MNVNLQFTAVPLSPTLTLFEERVGVELVSCTGTCVPSVQTGGHFLFSRPTPYLVVSYHREHDIDRFLATPFLIDLLLLSATSYGSFIIFPKILGLISYKGDSHEWAGTVYRYNNRLHFGGGGVFATFLECFFEEKKIDGVYSIQYIIQLHSALCCDL